MADWTDPRTWESEKLLSTVLNIHVRDNLSYLKENIGLGAASELTISAGSVTMAKSFHKIDTEGDASEDNLNTISGGVEGVVLFLRAENADRTVVVKDSAGNIVLGEDVRLDGIGKVLMLIHDGTNWRWPIAPVKEGLAYGIYGYSFYGECIYSTDD